MKKTLIYVLILTVSALILTACNDTHVDPDDSPKEDYVQEEQSDNKNTDPNIITLRKNAVISKTPEKYVTPETVLKDGIYYQRFAPFNVTGCLSSMQVNCGYYDAINVNSDSVMVYTQNAGSVESWNKVEDRFNIDMMIAINRADLDWAKEHPECIQTEKDGTLMIHGSGASYYMVPTEDFIEYTWDIVEWSIKEFNPTSIAFEEPEMWNVSGYSEGFKNEWKSYFNEEWQDPNSSPEAMLKSMELKTYLFERIIGVMAERIAKISPDTALYVATHSTVNYNAWDITAGLNHYMATGHVDGIIGQTWSDTIRSEFTYKDKKIQDEYLNAYLEFASYIDSVEGTNFFALADPMCDSTTSTEEKNRYSYLQNIVASLMHPEIHRFEICPWTDRAFGNVSISYKTILQQCFNALNEVGGKEITLIAGTPGIKYAMSDTMSWLKNSNWSIASSNAFYSITAPLATQGIPVGIKSMEQLHTAEDLEDTKILILCYDNQLPMSDEVNRAVSNWVKKGGTLLLLSGKNDYWNLDNRFWSEIGSPVEDLFEKMGLNVSVTETTSKATDPITCADFIKSQLENKKLVGIIRKFAVAYECNYESILCVGEDKIGFETPVGDGHLIAIGIPSSYYSSSIGADALKAIVKYATEHAGLEYVETNLMTVQRGNIVATHALREDETLKGTYINLFDDRMTIVTDPIVKAKDSGIFYDISNLDLSVPRLGFSGGEIITGTLSEESNKTSFNYTAAGNSIVASRLITAEGVYPESIKATCNGKEPEVTNIWNNETNSLLILIEGYAEPTEVEILWGNTPIEDGTDVKFIEEYVSCNEKNEDAEFIYFNNAGANSSLRFCDLDLELIYKFDLSKYKNARFSFSVFQNYLAEISGDGKNWTLIADYSQGGTVPHIYDGSNPIALTVSPAEYGINETFYFRLRNTDITQGWGGSITGIRWRYSVDDE